MSKITILVCPVCNKPVGNRMTVCIDGLLLCGRFCGIRAVGEERYNEAWDQRAKEINDRNNRFAERPALKVAK